MKFATIAKNQQGITDLEYFTMISQHYTRKKYIEVLGNLIVLEKRKLPHGKKIQNDS